jgi:hypothetical protein
MLLRPSTLVSPALPVLDVAGIAVSIAFAPPGAADLGNSESVRCTMILLPEDLGDRGHSLISPWDRGEKLFGHMLSSLCVGASLRPLFDDLKHRTPLAYHACLKQCEMKLAGARGSTLAVERAREQDCCCTKERNEACRWWRAVKGQEILKSFLCCRVRHFHTEKFIEWSQLEKEPQRAATKRRQSDCFGGCKVVCLLL